MTTQLRFGSRMQRIGQLLWSLLLIPFILLLPDLPNYTWGAALAFAGILAPLNLGATLELRSEAWFDEDAVGTRSVWRGKRQVRWEDIEDVDFSFAFGRFVIRGQDGTRLRISKLMDDCQDLAEALWNQCPGERTRRALYRWHVSNRTG